MPKVLPEYLETRRREILDAAAACFARRGFHQTTMQDICEEATLSPGAIYRYFGSKEEIIEAMCDRNRTEDSQTLRAAVDAASVQDTFNELTRVFLLGVQDREGCALSIQLMAEAPRNAAILDSVRRGRQEVRGLLTEFVRTAQARGEFNASLDPEAVAHVMVSLYVGLIVQIQAEPDIDLLSYARAVESLFDGSFSRPAAAAADTGGPAFRH